MSASPSVPSLQQLLARAATVSPAESLPRIRPPPSSSPEGDTSSPTLPSEREGAPTLRAPSSRSGWGATLSSALWYGAAPSPSAASDEGHPAATVIAGGQRARGMERGRIPLWGVEATDVREELRREDGAAVGEVGEGRGEEALAEVILSQAGDDSLDPPGPLLVIAGSRIPPPSEISHPALLARLRVRLESYAQTGPYSLVLLANPTPHAPTTAHLVSAYLSLSRIARKNVRRIYVVGGGWWTRVILGIVSSTLLSAKSARKLVQCPTLSSLAQGLGATAFRQIEFPLEVYTANAESEKEIVLPEDEQPPQAVFGAPLEVFGESGDELPPVVRDCIDVLLSQGPESLGIFRRSPSAAHVAHLRAAYARGHPVSLSSCPDAPYLAASLLKLYLRELPMPLFPRGVAWEIARACPLEDDEAAVAHIRDALLPLLTAPAHTMLQHLLAVLSAIAARAQQNLMTPSNLVICLCPALIGGLGDVPTLEEVEMCRVPGAEGMGTIKSLRRREQGNTVGGVLRVMIERFDDLFPPSSRADLTVRHLSQLPPSPAANSPRITTSRAARSASLSSRSSSSSAASHRSGRSTLRLKKKPGRAGAQGGAGLLIDVFWEDDDGDEAVQRVEVVGELTPARRAAEEG